MLTLWLRVSVWLLVCTCSCLAFALEGVEYFNYVAASSALIVFDKVMSLDVSAGGHGTSSYDMHLDRGSAFSLFYGRKLEDSIFGEAELTYRYVKFKDDLRSNLTGDTWALMGNVYYYLDFNELISVFVAPGIGGIKVFGSGSYVFNGGASGGYTGFEKYSFAYQIRFGYATRVSSVVVFYGTYQVFATPTVGTDVAYSSKCYQSSRCPGVAHISGMRFLDNVLESGIRYYF